jgi:hypothetical protein
MGGGGAEVREAGRSLRFTEFLVVEELGVRVAEILVLVTLTSGLRSQHNT